jgi:hypothetical protein
MKGSAIAVSLTCRSKSEDDFVHVTPHPILPGLPGPNDGVLGGVEMPGRVLVLGGIAASYMATGEAETEMDPVVTDPETVFTTGSARFDVLNLLHVRAFGHRILPGSREPLGN